MDIRKSKRYLFITGAVLATVVLLVWIAVIWGHSMMPGDMSSDESGFVAQILKPLLELLGFNDPNKRTYIVRKVAHFTEYAILAMLARGAKLDEAIPEANRFSAQIVQRDGSV